MQTLTAVQELTPADRERLCQIKKTAAFDEWRRLLRPTDRLPRGSFFRGKKAGAAPFFMDEFWQASAGKPYDLTNMDPSRPVVIGPSATKVTPESFARFMVMENVEIPSATARNVVASSDVQNQQPA